MLCQQTEEEVSRFRHWNKASEILFQTHIMINTKDNLSFKESYKGKVEVKESKSNRTHRGVRHGGRHAASNNKGDCQ